MAQLEIPGGIYGVRVRHAQPFDTAGTMLPFIEFTLKTLSNSFKICKKTKAHHVVTNIYVWPHV